MKKAIIISGPTASGKTDLAYSISHNIPTAIINGDSRHVFKNLDIISGKDLPAGAVYHKEGYYEYLGTKLYLFDLIEPTQEFSVAEYTKQVRELLTKLTTVPLFVGGSNFYISALIDPIETAEIPQDKNLRAQLNSLPVGQLQSKLSQVDEKRLLGMNISDRWNPRRLIRAIEVAQWKKSKNLPASSAPLQDYDILHIGLVAPLEYLRQKIDARVDSRLATGALDEAKNLFEQFDSLSPNVKAANGYKELFEFLECERSRTSLSFPRTRESNTSGSPIKSGMTAEERFEDAVQKWKYAEYHNAKKQLTWLQADSRIKKYSIQADHFPENILGEVLEFVS